MDSFEEIYLEYYEVVYKYVRGLCRNEKVAEDVTQEAFFKALKSVDKFRGDSKFEVWLCQIAKNTYFTMQKKERIPAVELVQSPNLEAQFIAKADSFEIHKIIHQMSEPYKEVFSLRIFGELSFAQIGELFQKSESWARVTYHRAKLKIKEELK